MARENKSKYAILGLLDIMPLSGYDIKKFTDDSLRFFWNENYGHIYPLLKELEKENLVTKQKIESDKGPPKNVYTITRKGSNDFLLWLKTLESPEKYRVEILLKLFFSAHLSPDEIRAKLENHIASYEQLLGEYAVIEKNFSHIPDARNRFSAEMTMLYGKQHAAMNIKWARDVLKKIQSL